MLADAIKKRTSNTNTEPIKGKCSPSHATCDFILGSNFVVWDVRNPYPKISRSYELHRQRYSTSKVSSMDLWNFR